MAWLTEDRHAEGDQPTTPRRASYIPAATPCSVTQSNAPSEIPSRATLALASRTMPPVLLSNTGTCTRYEGSTDLPGSQALVAQAAASPGSGRLDVLVPGSAERRGGQVVATTDRASLLRVLRTPWAKMSMSGQASPSATAVKLS